MHDGRPLHATCAYTVSVQVGSAMQALPEMLRSAEAMVIVLEESHNLVKAIRALVDLATPSNRFYR